MDDLLAALDLPSGPKDEFDDAEILDVPYEMHYVVDGLYQSDAFYVLAGEAKKGRKTLTLLHLVVCALTGRPFLGRFPVLRWPVILGQFEDGPMIVAQRLRRLGLRAEHIEGGMLKVYTNRAKVFAAMELVRARKRPHIVVLDPANDLEPTFGVKEENSSNEVSKLLTPLRDFAHETKSLVILTHHTRKADNDARGSGAFRGGCDGLVLTGVNANDTIITSGVWIRNGPTWEYAHRVETDDSLGPAAPFTFTYWDPKEVAPARGDGERTAKTANAIRVILAGAPDRVWPTAELEGEVGARKAGCQRKLFFKVLEGIVADGEAHLHKKGNAHFYRATALLLERMRAPEPDEDV